MPVAELARHPTPRESLRRATDPFQRPATSVPRHCNTAIRAIAQTTYFNIADRCRSQSAEELPVREEWYGKDGSLSRSETYEVIEVNVNLDPEICTLKLPPGIPIKDVALGEPFRSRPLPD